MRRESDTHGKTEKRTVFLSHSFFLSLTSFPLTSFFLRKRKNFSHDFLINQMYSDRSGFTCYTFIFWFPHFLSLSLLLFLFSLSLSQRLVQIIHERRKDVRPACNAPPMSFNFTPRVGKKKMKK